MELIERYLQSVRFWLPKTKQQEGILAELGDDLRSQIEEKETELGRPLEKQEVAEILKRCGAPMIVAGRLAPKRYLIGPTLFPIYLFVLKMVLLWILVPVFVFIVAPTNAVRSGDWGTAVANTLANLWSGLFIAAGVITLIFAILERTHAQMGMECKWDPMKLPPVRKHERKPSALQMACELAFNWFGLIWLLLVPHNPVLLFGPAAAFLKPGTLWDAFYIPVVAVSCFAIFRIAFALAKQQWTWLPPLGQMVQSLLGLVIVKYMLAAAGRITPGQWHPFVVLRDRANAPMVYVHVASIVNASLYISLICVWIGLCIAIAIQTWQLMRSVRKENSSREHAASLQML